MRAKEWREVAMRDTLGLPFESVEIGDKQIVRVSPAPAE